MKGWGKRNGRCERRRSEKEGGTKGEHRSEGRRACRTLPKKKLRGKLQLVEVG
jgi:hypothetical protein